MKSVMPGSPPRCNASAGNALRGHNALRIGITTGMGQLPRCRQETSLRGMLHRSLTCASPRPNGEFVPISMARPCVARRAHLSGRTRVEERPYAPHQSVQSQLASNDSNGRSFAFSIRSKGETREVLVEPITGVGADTR